MTLTTKIQLGTETILNIPLQEYKEDFTFIVNGQIFKTNRLIADLLSPNICRLHSIDPTINTFTINTQGKGDFSHVLNLIKFDLTEIPMNEIQFVLDVIENLGNNSIRFIEKIQHVKVTNDNVFTLIQKHMKYEKFYSKELFDDIDFISSHFYELCIIKREELKKLPCDILLNIVSNDLLQLSDEDQLLSFINELYSKNTEFAILFETVFFSNVSSKLMKEFIHVFEYKDMSQNIWHILLSRLENEEESQNKEPNKNCRRNEMISKRYEKAKRQGIMFPVSRDNNFSGIFKYLINKTDGNIENIINLTTSECNNFAFFCPSNVFRPDNKTFSSTNKPNSWICFEFKNLRVIPTFYAIKSSDNSKDFSHPRSWVIEGSINNTSWEILDEQKNCSFLNGRLLMHTFEIHNQTSKEFQFIRMRQTGATWFGDDTLEITYFEIYGKLIDYN